MNVMLRIFLLILAVALAAPAIFAQGVTPISQSAGAQEHSRDYVTILGEVNQPSRHKLTTTITIRDAIEKAGGLTANADCCGIRVTREGNSEAIHIDWSSNAKTEGSAGSLAKPADVIYVPLKKNAPVVIVFGEVVSNGPYPIKDNLTLIQAIALAGGITANADLSRIIIAQLGDKTARREIRLIANLEEIKAGRAADPKIQPGDSVIVSKKKSDKPLPVQIAHGATGPDL